MDKAGHESETADRPLGLLATVGSVLMAFLGVQSSRARKRDLSRGSPVLFIAVALGLTASFVLILVLVVRLLLRNAGL